ncbi:MAG: sigma 54-interacting transcriptional regulator [Spirochaetia bacterium]|jgi:DNA-binding NtrC family response regulator|nr:sigma 54-interacting transcriptional regulator [Spirochaetia bacterium]
MDIALLTANCNLGKQISQMNPTLKVKSFSILRTLISYIKRSGQVDCVFVDSEKQKEKPYTEQLIKQAGITVPIISMTELDGQKRLAGEIPLQFLSRQPIWGQGQPPETNSNHTQAVSYYDLLVGSSKQMQDIRAELHRLSKSDIKVHIIGETGSGKELAAQAIAEESIKKGKPFRSVNSSTLNMDLGQDHLFGHKKGAFTGAGLYYSGLLEAVDGGILFLDEVEDLSLKMQSILLRVLDNGEYFRLGETQKRKSTFRLITASNKDLQKLVAKGMIRKDFYFRIIGAQVHIPPLREHMEDLNELIAFHKDKKDQRPFNEKTMEFLKNYNYPGNVRELNAMIDQAINDSNEGDVLVLREWAGKKI